MDASPARGRTGVDTVTAAVAPSCVVVAVAAWLAGPAPSPPALALLLAIGAAAAVVVVSAVRMWDGSEPFRSARRAVLLTVMAAVPTAFDPSTADVFNVTKLTVVWVGAVLVAALWGLEWCALGTWPSLRNGLHWPVLALVTWTAVATSTSTSRVVSVFGLYGSFDGLAAAVAFAVLAVGVADAFSRDHLPRVVTVMYLAGAGPVAVYALVQLHDRLFPATWDWIDWGGAAFRATVWSSFGNPNHLAAFAAIIVPLGVCLLALHRGPLHRLLVGAIGVVMLAVGVQSGSRAAWIAMVVGLMVVAVLLPNIVRDLRPPVIAAAGAVVVVTILVATSTSGFEERLPDKLDFAEGSSASLRLEVWRTALGMGLERPVTGFGPDTFLLAHPARQTSGFVAAWGPDVGVNGAHNLLLNQLATTGWPGLAALVAVLAAWLLLVARAWRTTRRPESAKDPRGPGLRIVLAALSGAMVAYLVQASFNVQQLGLSAAFWTLLGLTAVCAGAVSPASRSNPRRRPPVIRAAAAVVVVAVTVPLVWLASGPYRADRAYKTGLMHAAVAADPRLPGPHRADLLSASSADMLSAVAAHPWEAEYREALARHLLLLSSHSRDRRSTLRLLEEADRSYDAALGIQPTSTRLLAGRAGILFTMIELDPSREPLREEGLELLRQAVQANPWEPLFILTLATELERSGEAEAALAVIRDGLDRLPAQPDLRRAADSLTQSMTMGVR